MSPFSKNAVSPTQYMLSAPGIALVSSTSCLETSMDIGMENNVLPLYIISVPFSVMYTISSFTGSKSLLRLSYCLPLAAQK